MTSSNPTEEFIESEFNLFSEKSEFEGKLVLDRVSRIYGKINGEIVGSPGSLIVLMESSVVEGTLRGDTIFVSGFVRGNIYAAQKIVLTRSGRVIGNLYAPNLSIEFGAHFEGRSQMTELKTPPNEASLRPASA